MIRLVGAADATPEALLPVATQLAEARDRQLDELGPGLAVNAVVICDAEVAPRESYRVCEELGVELVCFDDSYDRPRLAQLVTAQPEDLPSSHPAVHPTHQSDAEQQAEIDRIMAEDDGAEASLQEWLSEEGDDTGTMAPHGAIDSADAADDFGEGEIPQSLLWNDRHPYQLRLFIQEEPDFEMPPISLQHLTGAALRERKLQLARAYFGFDPEVEGIGCPLTLQGYERAFFVYGGSSLIEYRKPPRLPSRRGPSVRIGTISRLTRGSYLSLSTRVGAPTSAPAQGDDILTPVDDGDIVITSRRIAFIGERSHRDWRYDQLVSSRVETLRVEGFAPSKALMMSVSNRTKVSGFYLDSDIVSTLEFVIKLARCRSADERQSLVRSLAEDTRPAAAP